MSAAGVNMKRIYEAISHHNATCAYPAHTILLHPVEIERMGWDEGEEFRGCVVKAEPKQGTGTFRLLCDRDKPAETDEEKRELVKPRERDEELVPA